MLDISVVVLNYNGGSQLLRTLESVVRSHGVAWGLVVVDNASTDDSMRDAVRWYGERAQPDTSPVLFLRAGENLGYAAGNNVGVSGLAARYIALLNNDAVLGQDTLGALVRFLNEHPRCGICAPRLDWPDGSAQAYSFGGDPSPVYLVRRALARRTGRALHDWAPPRPLRVDWVAGTCMVLRHDALGHTGLLDDRIFMYFEDNDLCLRMRKRGWEVWLVPHAAVTHHNQPSYADRVRLRRYYRGMELFYRKHYGRLPAAGIRALSTVSMWRARGGR